MTITDERPAGPPATTAALPVMPLPLDVPPAAAADPDSPWWTVELTLNQLLPLLQIDRNALDSRRRRNSAYVPPLTRRGHRYFVTRRTYARWHERLVAGIAERRAEQVERDRVAAAVEAAPEPVRVMYDAQIERVRTLQAQAAQSLALAADLERDARALLGL